MEPYHQWDIRGRIRIRKRTIGDSEEYPGRPCSQPGDLSRDLIFSNQTGKEKDPEKPERCLARRHVLQQILNHGGGFTPRSWSLSSASRIMDQWRYSYHDDPEINQTLQAGNRKQCVYVWYEKSQHRRAGRILYDMAGFVDLLCLPAGQNSNPSSSSQKSEVINPGYDMDAGCLVVLGMCAIILACNGHGTVSVDRGSVGGRIA